MRKTDPTWLPEARELCHKSGINIMGWGPNMLTVEAKSAERAKEIAGQLGQLGFKALENQDDAYAGMLSLSKDPAAVQAKIAAFDISRRRWDEQLEPLIWGICAIGLLSSSFSHTQRYPSWFTFPLGVGLLVLFFWDAIRIWGWRLEVGPDELRVRRRFRWITIPWSQIRTIESVPRARTQESVVLHVTPHSLESLGTFVDAFARNLRDRLRQELAQHRADPHIGASSER